MAEAKKELTKICICALDTQFVHASPVPWALKAACAVFDKENHGTSYEVDVCEMSINDLCEDIVRTIMKKKPDVVAFSCYLWNITLVKRVVSDIKKINPGLVIVLGGPEVSYANESGSANSNRNIFERLPEADVVICGEGECAFPKVCRQISAGELGVGSKAVINEVDLTFWGNEEYQVKLAEMMLAQIGNRIAYIETSRGCPFGCIYCLASAGIRKVRNLDMSLVKKLLKMYSMSDVRQIKFVDRTFNVDAKRACQILNIILELYNECQTTELHTFPMSWHFEVAADLFTEEMLEIISNAPQGLFQFEIGLQSLNESVLEVVCRKTNTEKVLNNIQRLLDCGKCMIHTDLIAGLPGEDIDSFVDGFNQLHALYPHELQLGFLKCLEGAAINQVNEQYGMVYSEHPPYEVLRTDCMTWDEICHLKRVEEGVELLWNSGRFCNTVKYLCDNFYGGKAFKLYEDFAQCLHADAGVDGAAGAVGANKINEAVERLIEKLDYNADKAWTIFVSDIRTFGYSGKLPAKAEQLCGQEKIPFAEAMELAADKLLLSDEERRNARKFVKLWRLPDRKILAVNTGRKNALSNHYSSVILEIN